MKVAEDKKLEEMVKKLSNYCKANGYALVLSIGNKNESGDGVISCYGSEPMLIGQIAAFMEQMDTSSFKGFFKNAAYCFHETVKHFENYDEGKIFGDKAEVKKYVN